MFAGQHRLETLLDQLSPCPDNIGDTGVQRRRDPAVAPALARLRHVGLQQDAGLRQQWGGTLAFVDQVVELGAFIRAQPQTYFLTAISFAPGITSIVAVTVIQKTASDSMT